MKRELLLSQEAFDKFLGWLGPDRDSAGKKYEEIRRKLIKIFVRRGCTLAEELADETMDRVCLKASGIIDTYIGDPALYFYGVARRVRLERCRPNPSNNETTSLPAPPEEDDREEKERRHECLERCLSELTYEDRKMVLGYYKGDKTEKIEGRKEMADGLGVSANTLRIRVHRLRTKLQRCVLGCLQEDSTG